MIRLFLISLILLTLVNPVLAVTTISSLPYTASIPNETYELSGDLSSTTYGIEVTADGVTIDLKGYTLTWGTANGHATHGVAVGYNKSNVTVTSTVAGGALFHGATTNPAGCNGVYFQEVAVNPTVSNISITVKSRATDLSDPDCVNCQTEGILSKRTRNASVTNCIVDNQASEVLNRHSVPAGGIKLELDTVLASTSVVIQNNTVKSRHLGISTSGLTSGTDAVDISYNNIEMDQIAVNAYAISVGGPGGSTNTMVGGVNVHHNIVTVSGNGGRGIILSHLDYADVFQNTLTVGEAPTEESVWTNGVRLRYGARYVKVRENTINITCGTGGFSGGTGMRFTAKSDVDNSNPLDIDNVIQDNIINATNNSSTYNCVGVWFGDFEAENNWTFDGNTINTNDEAIRFEPDVGVTRTIEDVNIDNTTITKTALTSGVPFYAFTFFDNGFAFANVTNALINCTNYSGGAASTDLLESPAGTWDYSFTTVDCSVLPIKFLSIGSAGKITKWNN